MTMAGFDFRTNSKAADTLSFYVFDNLNASGGENGGNIYHFDTVQEATEAFKNIGEEHPDWLVALGGSIDDIHEIDFAHRREDGELVLLVDYKLLDFWAERPDVERAVEEIGETLDVDDVGERVLGMDPPDTGKPFLDYKTPYGTERVNIEIGTYADNDNIFVGLSSFDPELCCMEPYCDATVNLIKLPSFTACIDTNNSPRIMAFLEENGIAEPTGRALPSGFCLYPVVTFNPVKLAEL
ncbi:MAG: DUF4313 domain-containing protein, partial [Kiritimatiellae bacterium]|nr:DUF4313 domain-containing protein [Kiritimatiellia bacterium]